MRTRFPVFAIAVLAIIAACSPKIYRPPALGAEYRFQEGLRSKKPSQTLFDKNMQRYLEKEGQEEAPSKSSGGAPAAAVRSDSAAKAPARPDSLTTPAPPASPASPDSSHNGPR